MAQTLNMCNSRKEKYVSGLAEYWIIHLTICYYVLVPWIGYFCISHCKSYGPRIYFRICLLYKINRIHLLLQVATTPNDVMLIFKLTFCIQNIEKNLICCKSLGFELHFLQKCKTLQNKILYCLVHCFHQSHTLT